MQEIDTDRVAETIRQHQKRARGKARGRLELRFLGDLEAGVFHHLLNRLHQLGGDGGREADQQHLLQLLDRRRPGLGQGR